MLPLPFVAAVTLAAPVYVVVWLALVRRVDPEQVRVVRGLWIARLPQRTAP
jgi:hypothetical protein